MPLVEVGELLMNTVHLAFNIIGGTVMMNNMFPSLVILETVKKKMIYEQIYSETIHNHPESC